MAKKIGTFEVAFPGNFNTLTWAWQTSHWHAVNSISQFLLGPPVYSLYQHPTEPSHGLKTLAPDYNPAIGGPSYQLQDVFHWTTGKMQWLNLVENHQENGYILPFKSLKQIWQTRLVLVQKNIDNLDVSGNSSLSLPVIVVAMTTMIVLYNILIILYYQHSTLYQ